MKRENSWGAVSFFTGKSRGIKIRMGQEQHRARCGTYALDTKHFSEINDPINLPQNKLRVVKEA